LAMRLAAGAREADPTRISAELVALALVRAKCHAAQPDDKNWKEWLNNNRYTAGIVEEKPSKYIIYGEVKNNSIFDLPVDIIVSADLLTISAAKGTGTITNLLSELTGKEVVGKETAGEHFILPDLKSNQKGSFAVLLNYKQTGNTGINVLDLVKFTIERELDNVSIVPHYLPSLQVDSNQFQKQLAWQQIAKNGLPETLLMDKRRQEKYDNEKWRKEYQDILKRQRADYELSRQQRDAYERGEIKHKIKFHEEKADFLGTIYDSWWEVSCEKDGEVRRIFLDSKNADQPYYFKGLIYRDKFKTYEEAYTKLLFECGCK